MRAWTSLACVAVACGGATTSAPPQTALSQADKDRVAIADLASTEKDVREILSASDPRVAQRTGVTASEPVLSRIRQEAIMAEDGTTALRGASLDVFSFGARLRAIAAAAAELAKGPQSLPAQGPTGAALTRPRLERELVARMIEEERARASRESKLGDASAELVRAMMATWTPPSSPWEWQERDGWAARRLLEIGASFEHTTPRAAPSDLDSALYAFEKILVPMQFPRATAALTALHETLDADDRTSPTATSPAALAELARAHLGVVMSPESTDAVRARLQATLDKVRVELDAIAPPKAPLAEGVVADARQAMYAELPCAVTDASPVRAQQPPLERAAICGALRTILRAKSAEPSRVAALVALHDELLVAMRALVPQPRGAAIIGRATHGEDDFGDRVLHLATARPMIPLGVALAIEIAWRDPARAAAVAEAWLAFGDAPLDVVERELAVSVSSTPTPPPAPTVAAPPAPAAPRP